VDQPSTAPVPGGRPAAASRAPLAYERLLPSLPLCVSRVRMELDAALVLLDVAGLRRADVALVVTEAATNVVLHAYRTGAAGPLYATARLSGRTLEVTVCDCGGGHAGAGDSGGAGFGTPLMTALSDDLWVGTGGHAGAERPGEAPDGAIRAVRGRAPAAAVNRAARRQAARAARGAAIPRSSSARG
jgi:anti-sigma regulatory factor (Ser/Thr protein kinase)